VGGQTRLPRRAELCRASSGIEAVGRASTPTRRWAVGAALQGGAVRRAQDVLCCDVIALLGRETAGGCSRGSCPRNTHPVRRARVLSTAVDTSLTSTCTVLQGEREMAEDNKSLGTFS